MATNAKSFTVIDQIVRDLQDGQTTTKKKANTVTAAAGTTATFIATLLSLWVESGTSVPSWVPFVVVAVGMVGTTYGVSKTKNGVTDSLADKLHAQIAAKIDENHFHPVDDGAVSDLEKEVVRPAFVSQGSAAEAFDDLLQFAEAARNGFK